MKFFITLLFFSMLQVNTFASSSEKEAGTKLADEVNQVVSKIPETTLSSEYRDPETLNKDQRPLGFDAVRKAAIRFNMNCSGIYISNHGHILTALHCLQFTNPKVFGSIQTAVELSTSPDQTPIYSPKEDVSFEVRQFTNPNQKLQLIGGANLMGKVLVMGKGFYSMMNHFRAAKLDPNAYLNLMKEGYGAPEDFAIVKVNADNTPCVQISKENAKIGDIVWTIGYPMRLNHILGRPNWTDSAPGAFSIGKITNGLDDNPRIAKILKSPLNETDSQTISLVRSATNRDDGFFASTDGLSGASGSAMINDKGEVVGVFNATQEFGERMDYGYLSGSSTGSNIQRVVAAAKAQLDESAFNEAFSCN